MRFFHQRLNYTNIKISILTDTLSIIWPINDNELFIGAEESFYYRFIIHRQTLMFCFTVKKLSGILDVLCYASFPRDELVKINSFYILKAPS